MALEFTQKVWLNSKSKKDHCDSQNNLKYYKLQICIHGGKGAKRLWKTLELKKKILWIWLEYKLSGFYSIIYDAAAQLP